MKRADSSAQNGVRARGVKRFVAPVMQKTHRSSVLGIVNGFLIGMPLACPLVLDGQVLSLDIAGL
jgi:hypothetical protein